MSYLTKEYSVVVRWNDSESNFEAKCLEIPGCTAVDPDESEALRQVYEAIDLNVGFAREMNIEPPLPRHDKSYSGKLLLRIPSTLHKLLAERAEDEGASLNQFLSTTLAYAMGSEYTMQRVETRLKEWCDHTAMEMSVSQTEMYIDSASLHFTKREAQWNKVGPIGISTKETKSFAQKPA